jgi:RTX calcium-binding nonapeptide repeat (4 copies)
MRVAFAVAVLLGAAPGAHAATVTGALVDGHLEVRFRAAPGERNELRVLPHESGVRFAGSVPVMPGDHCRAVSENDVICGPPGPAGLDVRTHTGDGGDFVFTRIAGIAIEALHLGTGNDLARGNGFVAGGPGKDDLRVIAGGALFHGGTGPDVLVGGRLRDLLDGGPGPDLAVGGRRFDEVVGGAGRDQLVGGFGPDAIFAGPGNDRIRAADRKRDVIRCGTGRDVAYVSRRDRTAGCERIVLGWPN